MAKTCNCRSMLMGIVLLPLLSSTPLGKLAIAEQPKLQPPEAVEFRDGQQAVSLFANQLSLQALAQRIEAMSGIHVVIAADLAHTRVNVSVASPDWLAALRELFRDYSTVVAWNEQGKAHSFYVLASTPVDTSFTADSNITVATDEAGPESGSHHRMVAVIDASVVNPGDATRAAPENQVSMTNASVLEFMASSPANIIAADKQIQGSMLEPAIRDLLQRMRTVEAKAETTK